MAKKAAAVKKMARPRTTMSDQHKAALAEGRDQGRAVRRYLEALEQNRPKRGRKRTRETVERRLEAIDQRLVDANPLSRLHLTQERQDLEAELAGMVGDGVNMAELEDAFVAAARLVRRPPRASPMRRGEPQASHWPFSVAPESPAPRSPMTFIECSLRAVVVRRRRVSTPPVKV